MEFFYNLVTHWIFPWIIIIILVAIIYKMSKSEKFSLLELFKPSVIDVGSVKIQETLINLPNIAMETPIKQNEGVFNNLNPLRVDKIDDYQMRISQHEEEIEDGYKHKGDFTEYMRK